MYIWHRTPLWQAPATVSHDVRDWFRRQGGAARRQDPAAEQHDVWSVPSCHMEAGSFLFFLVFHF
jgi:hypothetical protein